MQQDIEESRRKTAAINRQLTQEIAIRKRIEESLKRQAEELEKVNAELDKANRELKEFAYIVSHDLKAPLRAIASLASWIQEDSSAKLDETGREYLNLLINRVDRMNGLIDGILQYSRIGRLREQMQDTDLNRLVQGVVDILAPPAAILVHIVNPLPVLHLEPTRLEQVFLNLIGNAIKYMDKESGIIQVGCAPKKDQWLFWVKDNGPGIESRYFDRIFQIFQTLAPRDQIESTGIGLTIVKKIVEMHGGKVWLESEIGQGSTFFFSLAKTINPDLTGG